ncbi:MAG TPA: anti-sigma factor [Acidimicrobiales bacterium]|nr:anti-sigma factor [Acidimicrobiales bacterium]
MTEDLSHTEIQNLLGAYALDAVDEWERVLIESHLETCESCRVELDDHGRLAETLRRHASRVSPLASLEANGSAKNGGSARAQPRRRWGSAAQVAILLLLLGVLIAQAQVRFDTLEGRLDRVELLERAQLAMADPDAIVTTLRNPANDPVLTVVSRAAGGDSYAMNSTLPRLSEGQTYQLWRVDSRGHTAAGEPLGGPDALVFSLPPGVTGFLITVEKGSAPDRPTLPAVASGRVLP